MREVHVVVPAGIDDPARPSGGNTYDRRVCRGLAARGWTVREHAVNGRPHVIERIPDGALVLLDGLIACGAPEVLVPHAGRLRQVVLVHMPFGDRIGGPVRAREGAVLAAAAAVVATSSWARRRLLDLYALAPETVHVAPPGVDASPVAPGSAAGAMLLCVAAVTPGKGHDVLLDALATLAGLDWRCICAGSLDRDRRWAAAVLGRAPARVAFPGPQAGPALERAYAAADLLVFPSRAETYGMVVTEALARGVPVVASDVGGIPEALGRARHGCRPGLLVPPGDAAALGEALRRWLADAPLRERLRRAARERRAALEGWAATTGALAGVLEGAAA